MPDLADVAAACRPLALLLVAIAAAAPPAAAAGLEDLAPPALAAPAVDFLAAAPVIDGELDAHLAPLPVRPFAQVHRDGTAAAPGPARFRLAYGTDFLYLHVEVAGTELYCRDRAYQNGDGLQLVVSRVMPDGAPSREFYVLAASAVDRPQMEWSRRVFWYYNVDDIFVPVSEGTRLATAAGGGTVRFELLLPWADVHPWHPWLGDGVGLDLAFCKGTADGGLFYYVARPYTRYLGVENQPRETTPLDFAPPALSAGAAPQTFVQLSRGHAGPADPLALRAVTAAADAGTERLAVTWRTAEGDRVHRQTIAYDCGPGLTRHVAAVDRADLPPGGYRLRWSSRAPGGGGELPLSLLPACDRGALLARLQAAAPALAPGSRTTLEFRIEELAGDLAALHSYETAAAERLALARLLVDLDTAAAGADPVARRTGLQRRAYRSALDGTLQPYMVRIPADLDPARTYPLLVYLHGSASDETDLAGAGYVDPGGCLLMAPRGRGPSNGWTRDHAQQDVAEALADMLANYPVDPDRIVLIGFSMGGYGVYRTHLAQPDRFRGLAVLSGLPTYGAGSPDVRDPAHLAAFAGRDLFVFHGERDRNCPFDLTASLVGDLRAAGARVEFVTEPQTGHEAMGPESRERLHAWLRTLLALPSPPPSPARAPGS